MAVNRREILSAAKELIEGINKFKKVYTAQTSLAKENSFPICWVLLGDEDLSPATMSQNFRILTLIYRIAVKQNLGEDSLNPLIDTVVETITNNYQLDNKVIKADITNIDTDEGLLYPYSVADIVCELTTR